MFVCSGWGTRLREERERASRTQDAFTSRNTQRAYEQEKNAPDLRFLTVLEEAGLDVAYIVTGQRGPIAMVDDEVALLTRIWPSLSAENCAALITLGRSLNKTEVPESLVVG